MVRAGRAAAALGAWAELSKGEQKGLLGAKPSKGELYPKGAGRLCE